MLRCKILKTNRLFLSTTDVVLGFLMDNTRKKCTNVIGFCLAFKVVLGLLQYKVIKTTRLLYAQHVVLRFRKERFPTYTC